MSDKNLSVFIDNIGRTILGETVSDTKTTLEIKNPAIVHVQPNQQTGQISVQLVPVFFKEFQAGDKNDSTWVWLKSNLVTAKDVNLDDRLKQQYTNMFSAIVAPSQPQLTGAGAGAGGDTPPVVKLFDD
tara:strand:+ start:380 stop:766 length:387 start_codon:yes stop_codon:yes gene_type:complete